VTTQRAERSRHHTRTMLFYTNKLIGDCIVKRGACKTPKERYFGQKGGLPTGPHWRVGGHLTGHVARGKPFGTGGKNPRRRFTTVTSEQRRTQKIVKNRGRSGQWIPFREKILEKKTPRGPSRVEHHHQRTIYFRRRAGNKIRKEKYKTARQTSQSHPKGAPRERPTRLKVKPEKRRLAGKKRNEWARGWGFKDGKLEKNPVHGSPKSETPRLSR